jgi:hypothetical protein
VAGNLTKLPVIAGELGVAETMRRKFNSIFNKYHLFIDKINPQQTAVNPHDLLLSVPAVYYCQSSQSTTGSSRTQPS